MDERIASSCGLAKLGNTRINPPFYSIYTSGSNATNPTGSTNQELAQKYPLNLMSPKSHAFLNSSDGNLPEQLQHAGEQTLLLHPQDASMRGIANGAVVRVFNDRVPCSRGDDYRRRYARRGSCSAGLLAELGRAQARHGLSMRVSMPTRALATFSDNLVEVALAAAGR